MSKLYELLQQAAKQNCFAEIMIYDRGKSRAEIGIFEKFTFDSEEELIARLSEILVKPLPESPELDAKFTEIEESLPLQNEYIRR